ncbi:TPA: hypothetical protein IUZ89_000007 [Enterococcus faecalis]|nr:hypothetical protein [Enterococcus faecalis]HAP5610234.1 hypothetical protein [Enterococcus faecalis]
MFILLIVATILMIFLIIYLTVTGNDKNDKNNKKKQKKETKRTTPTLNKKTTVPPSQKPNVVTDVAKKSEPEKQAVQRTQQPTTREDETSQFTRSQRHK